MKFSKIMLVGFSAVLFCGIQTQIVQSATTTDKGREGIVPCGVDAKDMCKICDLAEGIHRIVALITKLLLVTGTVIVVIAGVTYIVSTGNPSRITLAKSAMTNALVGTVIVLSAFMIVTFLINTVFGASAKVNNSGITGMGAKVWTFKCD